MTSAKAPVRQRLTIARRLIADRLPDRVGLALRPRDQRFALAEVRPPVVAPRGDAKLYIAPVNFAGQGYRWARAAERLPGVGAVAMQYRGDGDLGFPADYDVPRLVFARSGTWARAQRRAVASGFTHVLIEAERAIFGSAFDGFVEREAAWLRSRGLQVGFVSHGTDLRLPSRHALHEWSPFRPTEQDWVLPLETQAVRNSALLERVDASVFVSTPDLLRDWPDATWLPVVVDAGHWAAPEPPLQRERPVALHAPTNPRFKGTAAIEPLLGALTEEGVIEYQRVSGVPAAQMPDLYARADMVLEQFAIGTYSVTAVEAMAAGRLVVAHVHSQVRDHVRDVSGLDVPVVEATPGNLSDVLRDICANRDRYRAIAARGPEFVAEVHDGRLAARALGPFLGVSSC